MRDICFVDCETTGLEPWVDDPGRTKEKGVVLSVGFITSKNKKHEVIITPTIDEWGHASPGALKVNGMTWDYLKENGVSKRVAILEILAWLNLEGINNNSYIFMAQNASFDKKFLLSFMGEWLKLANAPEHWVDFIPIYKYVGRRCKLATSRCSQKFIAQQLGVPAEPAIHQAIEGAKSLKRNYDALRVLATEKKVAYPAYFLSLIDKQ